MTPEGTSIPWEKFGKDYSRARAEKRQKELEKAKNMIANEIMEKKSQENMRRNFMYYFLSI